MGVSKVLLRSILLKNLRDRRMAIFWWSISFFLLVIMMCAMFPTIQESAAELEAYMDSYPDSVRAAFGVEEGTSIASPTGFFNIELFSLMIPIMFLIFAVGFGSNAIAGEEEAGTLDLLLANPLPRWRIVLEKFAAMVLGTGLIAFITWVSFLIGTKAFDIDIGIGGLAAATTSSALLGLAFGVVALAVGSATGRRGLAIAVAIALTTMSYLLNIMSKIVESVEPYEQLSLFYFQVDANPLVNGLKLGDAAVFVGVIAVLLAIALVSFQRRDLVG